MSAPGIGTVVRYHLSSTADVPATVVATATTWNSDMSSQYGGSGPTGNGVYLLSYQQVSGTTGWWVLENITEGMSVGQFSLLTTEVKDN